MLKFKTWCDFNIDAARRSLAITRQNTVNASLNIFTIVIMLVVLTLLWLSAAILHAVDVDWRSKKQLTIYMQVPSTAEQNAILLSAVAKTPGIADARLISPDEALQTMQRDIGVRDIMDYLPNNPLPAVIDASPSEDIVDNQNLSALARQINSYAHVAEVAVDLPALQRVAMFLAVVLVVIKVFMFLLALALLLIVANALRLTLYDRQDEIVVLKFVGASDSYIRRPYLYIGCLYSLLAAVLAVVLLNFLLFGLREQLQELLSNYTVAYQIPYLQLADMLGVLGLALVVGWLGARFATRKYLQC